MCNRSIARKGAAVPFDTSETIVRSTVLGADRETVWRAISSDDGLSGWLAERAELDLRPGGDGVVVLPGGHERRLRVETVAEDESLVFTWAPAGDPDAETRVELRLEDAGENATRITVVESGFEAAGPQAGARAAAAAWAWDAVLVALAALVLLVAVG
jgi:uncharacterized protein YndB with AHSA1/START domain